MTDAETAVVEQTLRINARPETVWRYWTDPARMCDWWGAAAELDPRPGGACVIEMGGGGVMRGEYVELVPHERIVFTFGWDPHTDAPDLAPGSTLVEVTLTPDGDDTILTLRHTGLPSTVADEHRAGWSHFLPLLAAAAHGARPPRGGAAGMSVDVEPGERLVMRTAEGPFPMETTYIWSANPDGGTHMTLRNRGEPSGFSKLAAPLMAPAMRRANRKDLANLKAILERR